MWVFFPKSCTIGSYVKFMKSVKYNFHLWYILQVNTQLFSAREKQQLAELIDTMIGYNLTYHQERNFEGQYTYVLDPWVLITRMYLRNTIRPSLQFVKIARYFFFPRNIEEAVKFSGLPQHRQLTYANKQLIGREVITSALALLLSDLFL